MKQEFLGILQLTLLLSLRSLSQPTGTYTSLQGYVSWSQSTLQSNQLVDVDPATGRIHVVLSAYPDSLSFTRYTHYAVSSDGGTTWQNNVMVPFFEYSSHPAISIPQGGLFSGRPMISTHVNDNELMSRVYFEETPGAFWSLPDLPLLSWSNGGEPIFPFVACPSDGSVVVLATGWYNDSSACFLNRIGGDFMTWNDWTTFPEGQHGLGIARNETGRVCALANTSTWPTRLLLLESTDNGATWPDSAVTIMPESFVVGSDTFVLRTSISYPIDVVYLGNDPVVVFVASKITNGQWCECTAIGFWLQSLGVKILAGPEFSLGEPVIGVSGSVLIMAYRRSFGTLGGDADIHVTKSHDGGITWSTPENITQSPGVDELHLSISKHNASGHAGLVWVETSTPPGGSYWRFGRQKFLNLTATTPVPENENESPLQFKLMQNYPNPFNPVTTFQFSIVNNQLTMLKVYDLLGREVATIVNETLEPGTYQRTFNGEGLSSGVYLYRLTAGDFVETRKLLLIK